MTVRSVNASRTRRLRHAVLRPDELWEATAYPGDTAASTLHVGAFAGSALAGVASVYQEAPPGSDDEGAWRLRGMATEPDARSQGHGAALLAACVGHVARMGGRRLWCNARASATAFYARGGFTRRSEPFDIPRIGAHVVMDRPVSPGDLATALGPDPDAECRRSDRLVLRRWRAEDLDACAAINAEAETMAMVGPSRPLTRAESAAALDVLCHHWAIHGFGLWAVEERATGRLIGRAGVWHPPDWPYTEIGWLLGRDWWGRGLATEAAKTGLTYAFACRSVDRLSSIIRPGNLASMRVAERVGMHPAGVATWRGNPVWTYAITRDQWEAGPT